jgi:hypothetical protein
MKRCVVLGIVDIYMNGQGEPGAHTKPTLETCRAAPAHAPAPTSTMEALELRRVELSSNFLTFFFDLSKY